MLKYFYIGVGGAFGALLRYWVSGITHRFFYGGFPWGTLAVNLIGSLLIGFIWGISELTVISQNTRVLLMVGILGSFTTFSTLSLESFHLLRDGEYGYFFTNIFASFILGVGLVFAGYFIARLLGDLTR